MDREGERPTVTVAVSARLPRIRLNRKGHCAIACLCGRSYLNPSSIADGLPAATRSRRDADISRAARRAETD